MCPTVEDYFLFPSVPFCSLINDVITRRSVGKRHGVGSMCMCTVLVS